MLSLRRQLWALGRRMACLGADRTRIRSEHFGLFYRRGREVNFQAKQAKRLLRILHLLHILRYKVEASHNLCKKVPNSPNDFYRGYRLS
jgi:hypothetical protein